MPLRTVTVFRGADLDRDNAFEPGQWAEIMLNVDNALSVEPIDLATLAAHGPKPNPSPPVIPPVVAGTPPTIQHTSVHAASLPTGAAKPFPCVTVRFASPTKEFTAKGELSDFAPGGTPPKYDAEADKAKAEKAAKDHAADDKAAAAQASRQASADFSGKPAGGK